MNINPLLKKVVESGPEEFLSILTEIPSDQMALRLYARGLQHYLLSETHLLVEVIDRLKALPTHPEQKCYIVLLQIRLFIRTRKITESNLEILKSILSFEINPILKAEIFFIYAMALEVLDIHDLSRDYYILAAKQYEQAQCNKKSAKAELNAIVSDSHIFPDKKRHIVNYMRVFRKCSRVRELGMAGVALINVAAEYYRLGAPNVALKFAKRALVFLENDFGTRHYFLALLQKAEILFGLGRNGEAQTCMEEVATASFPEVQEAYKVLAAQVDPSFTATIDAQKLVPTWKEKIAGICVPNGFVLGETEQKLLKYLSQAPRSRHDLVVLLYGETGDYESLCNRLHVLMNRVRKKIPGIIVFENSNYSVVDDAPLSMTQRL